MDSHHSELNSTFVGTLVSLPIKSVAVKSNLAPYDKQVLSFGGFLVGEAACDAVNFTNPNELIKNKVQ